MASNPPRRATFWPPQATLDLMKKIDGTAQQERFWEFLIHGSSHGILEARAGSGKTFSIVQGILRLPPSIRVRVFSFNKHIMTALQNQLKAAGIFWASAQTYHSFGLSVLRRNFNCEVEQDKVLMLIHKYSKEANKLARLAGKQYSAHVQAIADIISKLKNCYMEATPSNVSWIMDRFDVDCERDPDWLALICKEILERNNQATNMVDFDDMIYMPVKLELRLPDADLVMVDECVAGDTQILLADGTTKPICDLEGYRGKITSCALAEEALVDEPILKWHKIPLSRHAVRISIRSEVDSVDVDESLVCTEDHRLHSDGSWVQASDLRTGDKLLHIREPWFADEAEIISIEEYLPKEPFVYDITVADTHCYFANGILVHNCQDTNPTQQELVLRACPYGRIVPVGDSRQAMYSWRGASTDAIPRLQRALTNTELGCEVYPLTITRRCPQSHVDLARGIVSDIEAMEEAPDGIISSISPSGAPDLVVPGDIVMCRTNAPLIPNCYAILSRGIPAKVQGLDLSKGLLSLIKRLEPEDIADLTVKLEKYYSDQVNLELDRARLKEEEGEFYNARKANMKLSNLRDKVDCLIALAVQQPSVNALISTIQTMFSEEKSNDGDKVILGTIHRLKGIESGRTFVLAPELIPHPLAEEEWEREQECNIAYVAATRAKWSKDGQGSLTWAGKQPRIYKGIYETVKDARRDEQKQEEHF